METRTIGGTGYGRLWSSLSLGLALMLAVDVSRSAAQSFNSGSDGSDGALYVAANQGTIVFDPSDTVRWGRVLDADGDGVYHFTTITVGGGTTTLRILGDKVNKPVHFLATGDVVIGGVLDLNGGNATTTSTLIERRQALIPGAGGYAGGAGGRTNSPAAPAMPGEGPGGGSGGITTGFWGCSVQYICGRGGTFTGNRYLVPLIGGSGGEGARWTDYFYSGGSGAGAILIASSTSITLLGTISARGGNGYAGGGGGGGAIRLVAPVLAGSGALNVSAGTGGFGNPGGNGWVRLEGFQISNQFSFPAGTALVTRGSPVDPASLRPSGSVRVTAIGGVPIPVYPSGTFALPDATINSGSPVNVDIQGTGIPPGTVVTLRVVPETPDDLTVVYLPAVQATLEGTLESSTATVSFAFPYGFSRGYARATWTQ